MNNRIHSTQAVRLATYTAALLLTLCGAQVSRAQVIKTFTQRTSAHTPGTKIYNIKGDFQMIGNANLTLVSYGVNGNNSDPMKYVDIDNDDATFNSSSANLVFSNENGANPDCSQIIYAGLYWTGRADDTGASPNPVEIVPAINDDVYHTQTIPTTAYTLTITRQGANNNYHVRYTFTPSPVSSGNTVYFDFTNNDNSAANVVTVTVNGVTSNVPCTVVTGTGNNDRTATFATPYVISSGAAYGELTVTGLLRDKRTNRTERQYQSYCYASVELTGRSLDKRELKLKYGTEPYITLTANDNDILYPSNQYDNMYAGYVEVTDYVKTHGAGTYTVADIALRAGSGGNTGYYGGWGMIVVYENSKMKWRDVTIFDGYAYVVGGTAQHELPVSGFRTAQNGPIQLKLGIIAGEGDRDIPEDYFQILKQGTAGTWISLSHSGNTTGNFFNGSIVTGGNSRNPSYTNNFGLDIAMFNINNTGNSIITNNQTSTKFRYGSTQDTYIIPCIAMAVDAYVPDAEAFNQITTTTPIPAAGLNPGDEVEYKLEVRNKGSEAISNFTVEVPIPYTSTYVSSSTAYPGFTPTGANLEFKPAMGAAGTLVWTIGNLPLLADKNTLLAVLTYRLKATTDCYILQNPKCTPKITIDGNTSGTGVNSNYSFSGLRFIQGYQTGACSDEPDYTPVSIPFNPATIDTQCPTPSENPDIYKKRIFYLCQLTGNTIPFTEISNTFPGETRFYSTVELYTDPVLGQVARPTATATQYTATTGFPRVNGTYYAIPPGITSCYWEFDIEVNDCKNLWVGAQSVLWQNPMNWTKKFVPMTNQDVEFATAANNQLPASDPLAGAAQRDLQLDKDRTIGSLTNATDKKLIIPAATGLTLKGKLTGSETAVKADKINILAQKNTPNGSLILNPTVQDAATPVYGTVQLYVKAYKDAAMGTWTDNIEGSPTKGTEFKTQYHWQFFGVPVEKITANPAFYYAFLRKYDETKNLPNSFYGKWETLTNSYELKAFEGYEITYDKAAGEDKVCTIAGKLQYGDRNLTLTRQAAELTHPVTGAKVRYGLGQNIFGNSYTASIDVDKIVFPATVEESVYLYNTGRFTDWGNAAPAPNDGVALTAGQYTAIPKNTASVTFGDGIPSMNGFLLIFKADEIAAGPAADATVTLKYADGGVVTNKKPQTAPKAEPSYLHIRLNSASTVDNLWLFSQVGTSEKFDNGWDGRKFFGTPTAFIYSETPDGPMQVNTNSTIDGSAISFYSCKDTEYELTLTKSGLDNNYHDLTLVDLHLRKIIPLTEKSTSYTFNVEKSNISEKRFKIVNNANISFNGDELKLFNGYLKDNNTLIVNNFTSKSGVMQLFDVSGKMIMNTGIMPSVNEIPVALKSGVYILKLQADEKNESIKLLVK